MIENFNFSIVKCDAFEDHLSTHIISTQSNQLCGNKHLEVRNEMSEYRSTAFSFRTFQFKSGSTQQQLQLSCTLNLEASQDYIQPEKKVSPLPLCLKGFFKQNLTVVYHNLCFTTFFIQMSFQQWKFQQHQNLITTLPK